MRGYKIGETSRIFGVHPNTLRKWEKEGKVKAVRMGRDLEQKLKGIKLKQINPAYTSKRCHVCGSFLKGRGPYLFCENCKKKWDRDYNAA
ncbi:MAG: hypothetical protein DRG39_01035 [Deltaproteobacteria bacterium]|nr:MAG: hypothetical protein DRG39_01035 [Deltaproteobacteria bacterium]